jgi:hypothetical protein
MMGAKFLNPWAAIGTGVSSKPLPNPNELLTGMEYMLEFQ